VVERRHRHEDLHQIEACQRLQQIDVALDEGGLGHDAHRMPGLGEHFEDTAGEAEFALDRLIGVGVGAEHDRRTPVARRPELPPQQRGGLGLGEQAALEV
jgi:hypothetical protein